MMKGEEKRSALICLASAAPTSVLNPLNSRMVI